MALQTDTYANLLSLIEALFGASFTTSEQTRVKHLVNRRAHAAYRESNLWPELLEIDEERAVDGGNKIVPYTGAAYDAQSGARQPYNHAVDSFFRIHQKKPWDSTNATEFQFQGATDGARLINYSAGYGLATTPSATTSSSGTVTVTLGSSGSNTYLDAYVGSTVKLENYDTDTIDINDTHTVTAVSDAIYLLGYTQIQFEISDQTTHTWTIAGDEEVKVPSVFCTYKGRLANTYGDGSGETTAVPQCWFEYIAHGVVSDMLRADQQWEAAQIQEGEANRVLQRELERLDSQHTGETVFNRVRTHRSENRESITVS